MVQPGHFGTNVLKITEEFASGVREGEGVTQKNHWKEMTAVAMMESQMRESADFLRARPE